jgi:pimeloyl-ACP methyl ester carboxylesterase
VLVGHSYTGFLISQAAAADPNVKGLVYVAAYIPMAGVSPADLTYMNPELTGSNPITRAEPTATDIYINPATFGQVYAGGLSKTEIATAPSCHQEACSTPSCKLAPTRDSGDSQSVTPLCGLPTTAAWTAWKPSRKTPSCRPREQAPRHLACEHAETRSAINGSKDRDGS